MNGQTLTPKSSLVNMQQPVKKRYEWIDNARVLAAFLIMSIHIPHIFFHESYASMEREHFVACELFFNAPVPFFLLLAGYFTARNITWKKALDRFWWLLIPYILWNLITKLIVEATVPVSWDEWMQMLGIKNIIFPVWAIVENGASTPINGPTWFLRDLAMLSLLAPCFVWLKRFLPLFIILYFSCVSLRLPVEIQPQTFLCPAHIVYFAMGVMLSGLNMKEAYHIFNHPQMHICMPGGGLFMIVFLSYPYLVPFQYIRGTFVMVILGIMMIAYIGVLIERHFPKLSHRLALCGPASFLIFVMHWPLFHLIHRCLPDSMSSSPLAWFMLIPAFFIIVYTFYAVKKWTPWLMPYLCHMKLQAIKDEKIRLMNYKKQEAAEAAKATE